MGISKPGGSGGSGGGGESVVLKQYGTTFEQLSISSNDNSQSAHGLSKAPDGIDAYLECTTADLGYSVGDRVYFAYTTRGLWWYDDTNIGWAGYSQRPYITHKSNNNEGQIGNNDWKAVARPFIYVDKDIGGGGGSGSTLTPETGVPLFVEADEHNLVNIDGHLNEIRQKLHAGHGKVFTTVELTDTRFGGVVPLGINAGLSSLQFVYETSPTGPNSYSRFVIYRASGLDGWTGYTGLYRYNPFAAGEPWADAPTGNTYTGSLAYHGSVVSEMDLEESIHGAGEAFVRLDTLEVVFVDTFTPPGVGEATYEPEEIGPNNNPVRWCWWGSGQAD